MTALILTILLGMFALRVATSLLNLRHLQPNPPPEFAGQIDEAAYARSQEYTRAKTRAALAEDMISLGLFLAFWGLGGFAWLHTWSQGWGWGPIATGLGAISLLAIGKALVDLPFEIHHTFGTEEKFGFNRTTPRVFVMDHVKSLMLGAALGLPVLAGLLKLFTLYPDAWLWGWLGFSAFAFVMAFLAPMIFLPMFNKFEPMPEGPLRAAIESMAKSCGFPLGGLFVMDGSKRSTKANAFFTGFGKHRRIALFDTLISRHSTSELVAVLAHEIGHFKCRHIWQQMILGFFSQGILFYLLGFALASPEIYRAFGLPGTDPLPLHFGLVFFLVLYTPVGQILSIASQAMSRKNEFEADAYAAKVTGAPHDLAEALRRLSSDSLSNLTPHPLAVWLDHTHPPVVERIRALASLAPAGRGISATP